MAIIGAGHNGLTCAAYLAAAGFRVTLYERRHVAGGAAVTEQFHPGFRNSTASYTVSLLHPKVRRDLRLDEHGLSIVERPLQNVVIEAPGRGLPLGPTGADTAAALARRGTADAGRLEAYHAYVGQAVDLLRDLLLKTPPTDLRRWRDTFSALSVANAFRALPLASQRAVHELFTRSAGEILDRWFEDPALKAAYGFDSIVGTYASPYTPGSAYVLLHHAFGEVNGRPGVWGHARGGMGAITQAMAREVERLGGRIELEAPVRQVLVERGRAAGLLLADGREVRARRVVANVSPRMLYLDLLGKEHVPPDVREAIRGFRCGSASFRMNVALSALPDFGADLHPRLHASGIILAPSLEYMDRAYRDARATGMSVEPVVEMLIPSTVDDSLCPPGTHVASLFCQHFAPELPDGRPWNEARDEAATRIIDTVSKYAPNFRDSVIAFSALSPADLEERFGLPSGDIFHGALGLDQIWAARPLLGYADYRTCVPGLWLCGSGAHPGGGVSGIPGYNCAREMLRDPRD